MRPRRLFQMMLLLIPTLAFAAAPGQTQWNLNTFTWVKRVPAEAGAPANAQPAALSPEALQALLGPVQATLEGQAQPLFAKEELKALSKALSGALAQAQPGEDLLLLSTFKRGGGFLELALGVTARLFIREGALNLIIHDARLDFMDRYLADRTVPTFHHGSRQAASGVILQATGATTLRGDWLAMPIQTATSAPISAATTAPAVKTPDLAPEAPTGPRDAAFYAAQSQRLKALKQMRDEGLLSEAEYQQKREAILKTL